MFQSDGDATATTLKYIRAAPVFSRYLYSTYTAQHSASDTKGICLVLACTLRTDLSVNTLLLNIFACYAALTIN